MMSEKKTCHTCLFFEKFESECRHDPPLRLPREFAPKATAASRVRDEKLMFGWPKVAPGQWCGKWEQQT